MLVKLTKERNDVCRVLRRISPGRGTVADLRPSCRNGREGGQRASLTPDEEQCLSISRAEFDEGKEIPMKSALKEICGHLGLSSSPLKSGSELFA